MISKVVSRNAIVAIVLVLAGAAHADAPCPQCVLEIPATKNAVPLLVVLHGDRDRAGNAIGKWRGAAKARGWAVLALQCPTAEGCKDSWWQWNGDPAWLHAQIDKVAKTTNIDRNHIVLAGWSGGATYLGMRAAEWKATALVIHGGGMAPQSTGCPKAMPAFFVVGNKNPLHHLAVDLRDYLIGCKQTIVWKEVDADHDGEDRALDTRQALFVLDWAAKL